GSDHLRALRGSVVLASLNPTTTINTISRLGCQRPPKINPACFSKYAKDSEENWDKELAKLDGIVVIGKFSPAKEGMERFSIESYQKEHLEKINASP
ncbi:hypothetical protein, partial [uncultured Delftia sp.]